MTENTNISNERLFEFMTKMYSEMRGMKEDMQGGFEEVNLRIDGVENKSRSIENEIKKINAKIDHQVMPKIDSLFDGYKQNSDKLDRIEEEVSKHEEIILRRIK